MRVKSVCLIPMILELTLNLQIQKPKNQDEYFSLLWESDHSVIGYIDSNNKSENLLMPEILKEISQSKLMAEFNTTIILADVSQIPMLFSHYSMSDLPNLFYIIKKQLVKFPNYSEMFNSSLSHKNSSSLIRKSVDFAENVLLNLTKEIFSVSQLEEILEDTKIVGVYFGKNDENFINFKKWTANYIDFRFLHSFDEKLKDEIFTKFLPKKIEEIPIFSVIRHHEMLNEYDNHKLVPFWKMKNMNDLSNFFDFERHPKYLNDSWGHQIVKRMFFKNEKLLLFVDNESKFDSERLVFEEFIAMVPKRFIFSSVDMNSVNMGAYMQLFMLAHSTMTPGRVYLIDVLVNRKVNITPLHGEVKIENLMSFVNDFIEKHSMYFGIQKPENEDHITTPIETEL